MSKTVMVSGCFDGLHAGHVCFLQQAAMFGRLIVVLGNDASVRLAKGRGRPIFPAEERAFMVRSLACVAQAVISEGAGHLDFMAEVKEFLPDIFIVNGDGHTAAKEKALRLHGNIEYKVLHKETYSLYPHRSTTEIYS